jgi:hypothetical protein
MPYCEHCGSQINPNAKFCFNCGAVQIVAPAPPQPVVQRPQYYAPPAFSPPPPPPPPPPMEPSHQPPPPMQPVTYLPPQTQPTASAPNYGSEPVVGAMIFRKPKSLGRYDSYTAVLTNQRLIIARLTDQMIVEAANQARAQAKADGKGFFGQWGDQLKSTFGYSRKYLTMTPEAILAETPGNFALFNNAISQIDIKRKFNQNENAMDMPKVEVHSTSGEFEYEIQEDSDYIKLLKQVYGDRVKTPFGYFSKTIHIG